MPLPSPPLVDGFHSQAHKDAFLAAQAVIAADETQAFGDQEMLAWLRDLRKVWHVITDADGNKRLASTGGGHFNTIYWGTTHADRQTSVSVGTKTEHSTLYLENETVQANLSPYHDRTCLLVMGIGNGADAFQSALQPHERNRTIGVYVIARNNPNGSYPLWLDGQFCHPPDSSQPQGVFNIVLESGSGDHRGYLSQFGANPWGLSWSW